MKNTGLLVLFAAGSVVVMLGTTLIGRNTVFKTDPVREERQIGDRRPGPITTPAPVTWTPGTKHEGYAVTVTLKPYDLRVVQFADFPMLLPTHLPEGSHLTKASLSWDPETRIRLIQLAIEGKSVGIISEQRLQRSSPDFPAGMRLTTVSQPGGGVFRNLQSDVGGVGVSIAFDLTVSDDELMAILESLKASPAPPSLKRTHQPI